MKLLTLHQNPDTSQSRRFSKASIESDCVQIWSTSFILTGQTADISGNKQNFTLQHQLVLLIRNMWKLTALLHRPTGWRCNREHNTNITLNVFIYTCVVIKRADVETVREVTKQIYSTTLVTLQITCCIRAKSTKNMNLITVYRNMSFHLILCIRESVWGWTGNINFTFTFWGAHMSQ